MIQRCGRFRQVSRILPRLPSGNCLLQCGEARDCFTSSTSVTLFRPFLSKHTSLETLQRIFTSQRFSTASDASTEVSSSTEDAVVSVIRSILDELRGPNHVWLNVDERERPFLNRNGTFLVLAGQLLQDSDIVAMLEKVKFLEQRFSELCVVGFHAGSSVSLVADQARLVDLIANEYITFPILLCDKNFSEMEHGACYVLFGDSEDPLIYHEKDLDLGILCTAIEELHVRQKQNSDDSNSCLECLKGTWTKQSDTLKEPHGASYLQNLLLHFPGCVSADVCGSRLFFSGRNHHRIMISPRSMASRFVASKTTPFSIPFFLPHRCPRSDSKARFLSTLIQTEPPLPVELVSQISRLLSDHRNPQHDLERSLRIYRSQISPQVVEQVLKRCKNLGFSAHRFFLWANAIPGFQPTSDSFHILIDILGASRQFAILWDFLIQIRDSPHDHDFQVKSETFWLVFRAYTRANLPDEAIRSFGRMGEFDLKPRIDDVDQLVYVLCKRKHVKQAQAFFDRVKHELEPTVKTYSILVRGWGDIGDGVSARKMFDEMLQRGCEVDVLAYNSLLEALCKGGSVDEAYKMFRELGSVGIKPDACSYGIFIRAYCDSNDIHSAFGVLDRMRRYDLLPNVFTYNCLIKKLCKTDCIDEAYQLLDEMLGKGLSPDAWSYNAILAYHCEHTEVNRATNLVSRMAKDGCLPDRHSYNMVLKLLIRIGRFDRATEVWESMEERKFFPSVSTFAVMIHGLCKKKGKLEEACKYFELMVDEGIPPYSSTVEMLRNRLMGFGLMDNIEILAGKMERSSCCSIRELAIEMRGNKTHVRSRREETESESD